VTEGDERDRASLASLRRQVGEQVASAELVISTLRTRVEELQRREQTLVKERDELQRRIAKMTAVELQRAQTDGRERTLDDQYRRARQSIRELEEENEQLTRRCAELESSLTDALADNDATRQELEYVEKQVAELERISGLLNEPDGG